MIHVPQIAPKGLGRARRVLLYDPYDDFLQGPRDFTPLGILYLSAWLKRAGHEVTVLHEELDALPAGYEVYGVSATTPQYPKARAALARIRELEPEAIVALGGAHVNAARCRAEAIRDGFDFVVWGEGEITLHDIVEGRLRRESMTPEQRIVEGRKIPAVNGNIDDAPPPDRAAIDIRRYGYPIEGRKAATLMTARECPFKCQFCSSAGGVPRFHSIERVMEEVRHLVEDLGFRALLFVDDVFTFKEQSRLWPLLERLQEYRERYDVIWRCYSRTDLGMRSLERMRSAGCLEVGAGIESGSQDILDVTMKYTTVEGNLAFIEACAKADIMPNTFLMIGLPAETETTVRETRQWFERAAATFTRHSERQLRWGWNIFTPMPDCPNLLVWESDGRVPQNSGPRKAHAGRYAGARMRDLINIHPMPYELSVMKARRGYITSCFIDTDTALLSGQGGLARERIFDLYQEGFEAFAAASGFDPRKRGDRAHAYEYGQAAAGETPPAR
jgi:radical SAM superfamily enzyme YgiQ (UPF0313 family)